LFGAPLVVAIIHPRHRQSAGAPKGPTARACSRGTTKPAEATGSLSSEHFCFNFGKKKNPSFLEFLGKGVFLNSKFG